jgi:hypothetical protein
MSRYMVKHLHFQTPIAFTSLKRKGLIRFAARHDPPCLAVIHHLLVDFGHSYSPSFGVVAGGEGVVDQARGWLRGPEGGWVPPIVRQDG